mmetsp:Transcript_6455/g.9308  ORF Transcript_6455/g.9308 Transcript_6455/m.9308 type:complete len:336 (-) Transcript_6455:98-1105(-)
MLVVSIGMNGWAVEPMSINPTIGPSGKTLLNLGAKQTNLIVNGGEWFRLFSPMVLHAGIIHYFLNMLALWFVGSAIEQSHGFVSTAIAFIIAGVGGNVLSAIFLPQYISVGASGGIFGFIGMCISDIVVNWNILFLKEPDGDEKGSRFRHYMILAWLVFDIFINCLVGLTPLVDNFTHLGGLIYGFLCGLSTIERIEIGFFGVNAASWEKIRSNLVKFGGLIISVLLIMITTVILVESDGATSPCHACRYVSCIPFPPLKENKWWYCDDCGSVAADANKVNEQAEFFDSLDLTCPDGQIERISIAAEMITDQEVIRRKLPAYCRNFCESVYHRSG